MVVTEIGELLKNSQPFAVICYKSGSTYYAAKYDGTLLSSSATCETVLSAAFAIGGACAIQGGAGDYILSAGFTGFDLPSGGSIYGLGNPNIVVPQGYTGYAFRLYQATFNNTLDGFAITEGGTPTRLWRAIQLESNISDGSIYHMLSNIFIQDAGTGIRLVTTSVGFVNANYFEHIQIDSPVIGIEFVQTAGEISENTFNSINVQAAAGITTTGYKDVDGTGNVFLNCKCWDIDITGTETKIKSTAVGTQIIGGRMTGFKGHFIDQGSKTVVLDVGRTNVSNLLAAPDLGKFGNWSGTLITNGEGLFNGRLTAIAVGTGTNTSALDSTGKYYTFDSGATINSISGLYVNTQLTSRINNAYFKTAIYLNSVANVRIFAGLVNSGAAPASAADPLNVLEGCALWLDTAVSANWKRMHNDNAGASTVDDTAVVAAISTLYPVEIYATQDSKFRFVFNGVSTDITTNIPASTTGLGFRVYIENTTGASRTFRSYYVVLRTDK